MKIFGFEKLDVYVAARQFVSALYALLTQFPDSERYALSDQLRRAVVSVPSNIAEGTCRSSNKEKAHFIEISYGSLMEVLCQLQVALDLGYIRQEQYDTYHAMIENLSYKLTALRQSYLKQ